MKQKLGIILAAALVAAISVNMAGCGSSAQNETTAQSSSATQSTSESSGQSGNSKTSQVDTMKLTLTDGTVEEFKGDELQKLAYSNNAAANKYCGAAVEMTTKVKKVTSWEFQDQIEFTNCTAVIDYHNSGQGHIDSISTLRQGDTLKVTGVIKRFEGGNCTPTIYTWSSSDKADESTTNSVKFTAEKVEG